MDGLAEMVDEGPGHDAVAFGGDETGQGSGGADRLGHRDELLHGATVPGQVCRGHEGGEIREHLAGQHAIGSGVHLEENATGVVGDLEAPGLVGTKRLKPKGVLDRKSRGLIALTGSALAPGRAGAFPGGLEHFGHQDHPFLLCLVVRVGGAISARSRSRLCHQGPKPLGAYAATRRFTLGGEK